MKIVIECQRCGKGKEIDATSYGNMIPITPVERKFIEEGWQRVRVVGELIDGEQEVYQDFWRCDEHPMTEDEFKDTQP